MWVYRTYRAEHEIQRLEGTFGIQIHDCQHLVARSFWIAGSHLQKPGLMGLADKNRPKKQKAFLNHLVLVQCYQWLYYAVLPFTFCTAACLLGYDLGIRAPSNRKLLDETNSPTSCWVGA